MRAFLTQLASNVVKTGHLGARMFERNLGGRNGAIFENGRLRAICAISSGAILAPPEILAIARKNPAPINPAPLWFAPFQPRTITTIATTEKVKKLEI